MLRQNTAVTLSLGPIVMAVDGTTVATSALNISASEIKISKNGGSLATKNDATEPVYDAGGNYIVTFNTTDLNTIGEFEIQIQKATALPFFKTYKVLSQVSYDALVSGSNIPSNIVSINANAINASSISADAITKIQSGLSLQSTVLEMSATQDAQGLTINNIALSATSIKAQTDKLLFNVSNYLKTEIDAIISSVDFSSAMKDSLNTATSGVLNQIITSGDFPNNSFGERILRVGKNLILEGTLPSQSGTPINAVLLPSTASITNGVYDPAIIQITNGTGISQSRTIYQYNGATQTAWLDRDWKVQPDATSQFQIIHNVGREEINEGLVTSASTLTVRLNANASTLNNNYMRQLIFIRSGVGQDQVRTILSYDGTTQTAIISEPWGTIPTSGSCYVMLPNRVFSDVIIEGQVGAGTISTTISANGGASMTGLVNTSDFYKGTIIKIIAGAGAGQTRLVTAYTNATGVFTITPAWATTPDTTSWFRVCHQGETDLGMWRATVPPTQTVAGRPDVGVVAMAANSIATGVIATNAIGNLALAAGSIRATNLATDTGLSIRTATAISAAATSIKLDASAKAVLNYYVGDTIIIVGGTNGVGQARLITAYATDRTATIDRAWDETPTGTIVFTISGPGAGIAKPILDKLDIVDVETSTIITKVDNISATMATEVSATANKNNILFQFPSISGDVNTILTSAHGGGQWDAVNTLPVVLSASQPYFTPASAGDNMGLTSATLTDLLKHSDLYDGQSIDYILEAAMAMVNGDFTISGNTMTLYKRDGLTPFSVITRTTTNRTRIS